MGLDWGETEIRRLWMAGWLFTTPRIRGMDHSGAWRIW